MQQESVNVHTLTTHFKLVHVETKTALHSTSKVLPAWAMGHQEVVASKNVDSTDGGWLIDTVVHPNPFVDPLLNVKEKPQDKLAAANMTFVDKFIELSLAMFAANNLLIVR